MFQGPWCTNEDLSPEERFLKAIICQAVEDIIRKHRTIPAYANKAPEGDAVKWLMHEPPENECALVSHFVGCCFWLGIDPDWVRRQVFMGLDYVNDNRKVRSKIVARMTRCQIFGLPAFVDEELIGEYHRMMRREAAKRRKG